MTWTIDLRKPEKETAGSKEASSSDCRLPRVTRWMALALRIENLVRTGVIANFAEAAALGSITRARISQIMNLINLAPDIQEELLFMTRPIRGNEPVLLAELQPICSEPAWNLQRQMWIRLMSR